MGKKRSRQQSSNGVGTGDSSESDGSQNVDKSQSSSRQCPHTSRSIDQNQVKKNINLEDIANNNFCHQCSKEGHTIKVKEVYVCLRCGVKSCSLEHSKEHFSKPHSDQHALSLNLNEKTVWCHGCDIDIDVSTNKKLNACVNNVESMHEKYLKGPIIKNSPKPTAEETITDNNLQAVPILPPKTKSPNVGVKGLYNLGNTCFFNSVLQCLAQTPKLIETLREMEATREVSIQLNDGRTLSGQLEMQDSLCGELAETLDNIKGAGASFSPQKVLNLLRRSVPQFKGNDQHDSHELLRHLLDSVRSSDLKRYRKIMLNELGLNGVDNNKVDTEKQKELKQLDREVTDKIMLVPDQVFRGFLVSRLECQECLHSSECVESFLDLSLPVTSEKPHPPSFRKKGCFGNNEEKGGSQMSKHQLKKERKLERKKNRGKHHGHHVKKNDFGQGETSVPSISEKGESDAEGDDGDVDSEWSDKKTEANSQGEELLCAGIPLPSSRITRLNNLNSYSGWSTPKPRSFFDGTKRPSGLIPLTEHGVPDISKLSISDSYQPQLQTFIRDSETVAKEEPSWLVNLHELLQPVENGNSSFSNELASSQNSKHLNNELCEGKREKEEEISSDDKALGDSSAEIKDENLKIWLNDQQASQPDESAWDESAPPIRPIALGPIPLDSPPEGNLNNNEPEPNSDDDVMEVGSLFEENATADTSGECSIQTCLAQFTLIELMTGNNRVGCETCTEKANKGKKDGKTIYTMSTKQLLISEAPPVLILHIKRFQVQMSSFRKLSRHVAFPLELDISPFCKPDTVARSQRKLLYSLYGIVEHSGNFSGGHYVAYVKVENQWFCISDSYVSEVKEARVLQAQAYLLFYKTL